MHHPDSIPRHERHHRQYVDANPERIIPGTVPAIAEAEHMARYAFAVPYGRGKLVLDEGCGVGYGSSYLLEHGAKAVLGLDYSADALDWARAHYARTGLEFRQTSFPPLPVADGAYDVVTAFEIIEHIEDDTRLLAECARVLVPGGVLLISTPNKALSSPGWVSAKNRHHVREYYLEDFRQVLGAGFSVEVFGQRKGSRLLRRERVSAFVARVAGGPLRLVKSLIPATLRRALRRLVVRAAAPSIERHATAADFVIAQSVLDQAEVFIAVCRRGG